MFWQGEDLIDPIRHSGLRAVEHENILLILADRDARFSRMEGPGEELRHLQERAMVITTPIASAVLIFGGRVGGPNIRTLTPVVPGDDLNEVGLEFQEMQPSVDEDAVVLLVGPVHVRAEVLEEPRRNGGDPFLARGGAVGGVRCVEGGVVGSAEIGTDPGEEAVGEGFARRVSEAGILREGAWEEERGADEFGEDGRTPVPGRVVALESAQQWFAIDQELGVMGVVEVCEADDHGGVGDAGEVEVQKDFEGEGGGLGVESGELGFHLLPVGIPAAVVDGEGVYAGAFSEVNVVGVVAVQGLCDDHVVGEDQGPAGASLAGG